MRFKKGTKVEVCGKKEFATGAWLCAEIISGNGHYYEVKYGSFPMTSEAVVERVPRKAIRPCPPPVEGAGSWVPNDLIEVFHNLSWKTVRVLEVVDATNFLVRLLGSPMRFIVHKSHTRVRQCWQNGKWFVVGKQGLENCGISMGKRQPGTRVKRHVGDDCFPMGKNIDIQKPSVVSTVTLKRGSPFGSYGFESHPTAAQKKRMMKKDGTNLPPPTIEKVDAIVYPNEFLGENYMHSSFQNRTAEFSIVDAGRVNDSFHVESTSCMEANSCTSSVGSCNAIGSDLPFRFSAHHTINIDDYCSDAESSTGLEHQEEGCSFSPDEELEIEVHRSELRNYCSAIGALHASGPLSWEDEAKLTNLRHELHISNDEHLMVLRNLVLANSRLLIS